jgi:hypothetical protein
MTVTGIPIHRVLRMMLWQQAKVVQWAADEVERRLNLLEE